MIQSSSKSFRAQEGVINPFHLFVKHIFAVRKLSDKVKKKLFYNLNFKCHLKFLLSVLICSSVFPSQINIQSSQNPKSSSEINQLCIFGIQFVYFLFIFGIRKCSEKILCTDSVLSSHQASAVAPFLFYSNLLLLLYFVS